MGNVQSELQHIANALTGLSGDERKFLESVLQGKILAVKEALGKDGNVIFARTREYENAWHIAALSGSLEMLEVLHRLGQGGTRKPLPGEEPPFRSKTKKGLTPMMISVKAGHERSSLFLLSIGANCRNTDMYGNTCVHYAALAGRVKILEVILNKADADDEGEEEFSPRGEDKLKIKEIGQKIGNVARNLGAAAVAGLSLGGADTMVLHAQRAKGRFAEMKNEVGLAPMHFACWNGHIDACQVLFSHKVKLDSQSSADSVAEVTCNGGSTVLHIAALRNNVEMVNWILEQHVKAVAAAPVIEPTDPRIIRDDYGYTPYMLARNMKREEVIPLVDPRGNLPSIETIKRNAELHRRTSIRKSEDSVASGDFAKRISASGGVAHPPTTYKPTEGWDPFGEKPVAPPPLPVHLPPLPPPPRAGGAKPLPVMPIKPPPAPPTSVKPIKPPPADVTSTSSPTPVADEPPLVAQSPPVMTASPSAPPAEFLCPITGKIMDDPVTAADGRTYERDAIEMWMEIGNSEFPGGGCKLEKKETTANTELLAKIVDWRKSQNL